MCTTNGIFSFVTDHDETDPPHGVQCYLLTDAANGARVAYYLLRIAALLAA